MAKREIIANAKLLICVFYYFSIFSVIISLFNVNFASPTAFFRKIGLAKIVKNIVILTGNLHYFPMQNFPNTVFSTSLSEIVPVRRPSLSRMERTSMATKSVGTCVVRPVSMAVMSSAIFIRMS